MLHNPSYKLSHLAQSDNTCISGTISICWVLPPLDAHIQTCITHSTSHTGITYHPPSHSTGAPGVLHTYHHSTHVHISLVLTAHHIHTQKHIIQCTHPPIYKTHPPPSPARIPAAVPARVQTRAPVLRHGPVHAHGPMPNAVMLAAVPAAPFLLLPTCMHACTRGQTQTVCVCVCGCVYVRACVNVNVHVRLHT